LIGLKIFLGEDVQYSPGLKSVEGVETISGGSGGHVGLIGNETNQTCYTNADCPPENVVYCNGNDLITSITYFICENGGCEVMGGGGGSQNCPFGCLDGECLADSPGKESGNETNQTCTDSDGGLNYYLKGEVSFLGGGNLSSVGWDYCLGNEVVEKYCENTLPATPIEYYCPYGCFDGACLTDSSGNESGNETQNETNYCTDAGGKCPSELRGCGHYEEFDLSCGTANVVCCEEIPFCGDGVCFYHPLLGYGEDELSCPGDCGNDSIYSCGDIDGFSVGKSSSDIAD